MKFSCPLCGIQKTVRINRRSKPYLRCDDCGVLMFVNRPSGMKLMADQKTPKVHKAVEESASSFFFNQ